MQSISLPLSLTWISKHKFQVECDWILLMHICYIHMLHIKQINFSWVMCLCFIYPNSIHCICFCANACTCFLKQGDKTCNFYKTDGSLYPIWHNIACWTYTITKYIGGWIGISSKFRPLSFIQYPISRQYLERHLFNNRVWFSYSGQINSNLTWKETFTYRTIDQFVKIIIKAPISISIIIIWKIMKWSERVEI